MTTARERYEGKTKVVTFRVDQEVFRQLEEVKAKSKLSYADLVKLGADISAAEIKSKMEERTCLEGKLAELKASIDQRRQEVDAFVAEEIKRRLADLDSEMQVYGLLDEGLSLEAVSYKLNIPLAKVLSCFQQLAKRREDKEGAERELLRACIRLHLENLRERRLALVFRPPGYEQTQKQLEGEIAWCEHLLNFPHESDPESKEFLLARYSARVWSAKVTDTQGTVAQQTVS